MIVIIIESLMKTKSLSLTFCEELQKKECDSEKITDMLNLLCTAHDWNTGMIYEIDQYNIFHLKEHTQTKQGTMPSKISLEEINNHVFCDYDQDSLYIQKETKFVEITFHMPFLLCYPIYDKKDKILGFIAFSFELLQTIDDKEKEKSLKIELMLLSHFVKDRMYENKVSFAIKSLEDILDNTGIDIYVNDFNNHDILYVNKSMAAPYGGVKAFMNRKCWEVLFPGQNGQCEFCPQKKLIDTQGNPTKIYTWDYERAMDGCWFRVFSSAFHWIDGRLAHVVSSADITDNKKYEALIHHMANYDELTKLPNRRMLLSECERRIQNATKTEQGYVLFFDIDGFKAINDTYGHDAGDEFLISLGAFFAHIPLLKESIYRNGGDEFVAIVGGENITKDHIKNLANSILYRFKKAWALEKGEVYCSTSIGVACYPEDGKTPEELMRVSDQAMYKVKKSGGAGFCFGYELKQS